MGAELIQIARVEVTAKLEQRSLVVGDALVQPAKQPQEPKHQTQLHRRSAHALGQRQLQLRAGPALVETQCPLPCWQKYLRARHDTIHLVPVDDVVVDLQSKTDEITDEVEKVKGN